jgi:hypothetical protein
MIARAFGRGLAAGAAGTTALNAATYADMALRGRGESDMPQRAVEQLAHQVGQEIPGQGDTRRHRLDGLGSLSGIATGVGLGAVASVLGPVLRRLPVPVSGVLLGALAMGATDASMTKLGLTDPKSWSTTDWLSDAVPHLAYGLAAAWTLQAFAN